MVEESGVRRRLGILGGGQLARMIAEAALRRGHQPVVLAGGDDDPAARPGVEVLIGDLDDVSAVQRLFSDVDAATVENEFLDLDVLRRAGAEKEGFRFRPGLEAIGVAQDKLLQKRLLDRLGIATADHEVIAEGRLEEGLELLERRFPEGFVLKWSRYGYDGRGNLVVRPDGAPARAAIQDFVASAERAGARVYGERLVSFRAELAMVATRSDEGTQVAYPLVVSRQEQGVCREVFGPATGFGFDAALEVEARRTLVAVGEALGLSGTFAVEFFLSSEGSLLVNEIAPRVHNTGHYTLFGDECSQFDLQVSAVLGERLEAPRVAGLALMRNLLGPASIGAGTPFPRPVTGPPPGIELVWYDKTTVAPMRKMGHLTARAGTPAEAESIARAMVAYEERLWTGMTQERV